MLINGECLEEMKQMKSNSVTTIITDPPYGLSFMGKKWDYDVPSVEVWEECLRVLKPGGTALIFAGSRTQHRMAVNVEDAGFLVKDTIMWLYGSGFPKATDISKQLDKGNKGKIIGEKSFGKTSTGQNSGWNPNAIAQTGKQDIRELVSKEAKLWNGWKSHGLKPAYEPILVCQKPNDGTYANNALKHGVSGLHIDGGRVGTGGGTHCNNKNENNKCLGHKDKNGRYGETFHVQSTSQGRFPANIILDDEVTDQEWKRYFYCAKASKKERNAGCEELEEEDSTARQVSSDWKVDNRHKDGGYNTAPQSKATNHHPTVKPLALMEYLCKLTATPTGGVVLDPFMGSGTTGIACKNTRRDFVGIELDKEYFEIAKARINNSNTLDL